MTTRTTPVPPTERERQLFTAGLYWARKNHLAWEFVSWYRLERRRGYSIGDAVMHALYEWDL